MERKRKSLDRISALPQDTIEKILTLIPLRDALRTSILSKKWRYSWTTIPKLEFNDNMIVSSGNRQLLDKYKFVNAIFHVFLQHTAPISEFSLSVTNKEFLRELHQIILHLSRRYNIKKFVFETLGTDTRLLPRSIFLLQGLEHIHLSYCAFEPPLHKILNMGFSMLKCLHFIEVSITKKMLQGFFTNCPLLEKFTWIRSYHPYFELTDCEWIELFKCLPSVQVLEISKFDINHLATGDLPHKLSISLPNLRILVLDVCFLELSFVLCVISGSPNLEKIKLKMCWDHDRWCCSESEVPDIQDYSGFNFGHLKEMEITSFNNHDLEMDFVKLIMANSPVLKKARIELHSEVSVDEELKMLRNLMNISFLRASPITIERPRPKI